MSRRVRVAVAGAGGAAQAVHLPILARMRDVEVAGIADPVEEKARTVGERFDQARAAPSLEELPGLEELDAVLVCTPNDTHEEVVRTALDAGLHVLCERPLAPTSEAAASMIEAARDVDRHLMVAMNHRYRLDLRHMREFLRRRELGEPFFVRSSWLHRRDRRARRGWRHDPDRAGGGVLMDLGVSALDAALWMLEFPTVERTAARFHRSEEVEESAAVLLRLEDGPTVSVEVTWEMWAEGSRHHLFALGTRGSAEAPPLRLIKERDGSPEDVTPPVETGEDNVYTASYRHEWEAFLRSVRGGEPTDDGREQVELMRIVEACYRSDREGREVDV